MRASNFGWLVPAFWNAVPGAPVPSAGYGAPPTVVLGSRGSWISGTRPVGRGSGSEKKYPADTRYASVGLGARAMLALAPNTDPMPLPAVDPVFRSNMPALSETVVPGASRGVFVMTLTTPVNALAPQTADAGPRITSICLMSVKFAGRKSHRTRPKKSR